VGGSGSLAVERLLAGTGFIAKPASLALLSGFGAKLYVASSMPSREARASLLPTRLDPVDRLLGGGLARGRLTELVGRRSAGRFSVVVAALASATSAGDAAALVDRGGHFDPQAARDAGVELERILWARPRRVKEALAAAEMLLATGFPLVAVELGLAPLRGAAPEAAWVRLARAAESEQATLVLSTPYRVSGFAAGAVVRMEEGRPVWVGGGQTPRLLVGSASRIFLERELRGSSRAGETLSLRVSETLPESAFLPLPARGERVGVRGESCALA
jgi:recA bacterial DNA recombination protein